MIANDWPMIGSDWLWLRLMASDARRRLATAGSWATCASLRTATSSAALWASPCSRAWVSRGRPCAAPMPVCCCGACRLPTRHEVTRRWPLGLSRSAVYPSTQPSCTSTRRDAPCWSSRRFAAPRRIGHFRIGPLSVSLVRGDRRRPRELVVRRARLAWSCAPRCKMKPKMKPKHKSHSFTIPPAQASDARPRPCVPRPRDHPCMRARADDCGLLDVDSSGRTPSCLVAAEACTHIHTCARGGVSLRLRRVALELTETTTRSRAPCTPPSARSNRLRTRPQRRSS